MKAGRLALPTSSRRILPKTRRDGRRFARVLRIAIARLPIAFGRSWKNSTAKTVRLGFNTPKHLRFVSTAADRTRLRSKVVPFFE